MSISRRDFLTKTAKTAAFSYPAMMALGLLKSAPAYPFKLHGNSKGKRIIILGAGITGMTAAYELSKAGYDCIILEARDRTGGRCWTVRNGTTGIETDQYEQIARFDNDQYFNAGPSRIPHHHELTLHYCKELNVPLQVYNNVNESTYFFSEGKGPLSNKKIRVREIHNDVRGYMSELLAKAIEHDKLDMAFTKEDSQKVIEYLRAEGGLDIDKLYKASERRGYKESPGAGNKSGLYSDPYTLGDILHSGLMDPDFYNVAEYSYELQMTMFQAIGGMGKIAEALENKTHEIIRPGCIVTSVKNTEQGVAITYKEGNTEKLVDGDLCICTIPLPVLSNIDNNFSSDVARAVDYISYMVTGKIGLQFKRRFWEEDEHIYGGITHTNNELTQIFYPSYDYLGKKGILTGYYNFNDKARKMSTLTYREREEIAIQKGRLIHPQYDKEFENSFSVSWNKTPYSLGGWAVYTTETRKNLYSALLKPDKNVYFAGEHMTYLNAWMAGAFESARKVSEEIHARINEQRVPQHVSQ